LNSAGLNLALSGVGGGVINQTGPNIAAGTQTATSGTVVFSNSNGVTFGMSNNSVVTASISGLTLSSLVPVYPYGRSTAVVAVGNATSGPVSLWPFYIDEPVSAGVMNIMMSASFTTNGTSSGQQTGGVRVGIYTRGTGASTSALYSLVTQSMAWNVTGNNSTYSINQITQTAYTGYGATAQTSSAGVNITSGYTGGKLVGVPINTLLTPGDYYLAMIATNSTSSINVGMTLSYVGAVLNTQQTAMAPIGSFSSAYTSGADPFGGRFLPLGGSWTSAGSVTGLPASMAIASISAGNATVFPFIRFWST
jgi:hypothetical protein